MARADTLDLLSSLVERLTPIGQMTLGSPLKAADWNSLVEAVRTMAQLAVSRERTTDDFLTEHFARIDHQHLGQVALEWLNPAARALIEQGVSGTVEQRTGLEALRNDIAQLREDIGEVKRQITDVRVQIDGLRDNDAARQRDLGKVTIRVEALRDVEQRVTGLDGRLGSLATNIEEVLKFRGQLVDDSGAPINVKSFGRRITELETIRENLKTADGSLVRIREFEKAIARLEDNAVKAVDVDSAIVNRLNDVNLLQKTGLIQAAGDQLETRFASRFTAIGETTARLDSSLAGIHGTLADHATKFDLEGRRLTNAEDQLTALKSTGDTVRQQQERLATVEGGLRLAQSALADLPALSARVDQFATQTAQIGNLKERLTDFDKRLKAGETATGGLVTSLQGVDGRVSTVEKGLPALRQAVDNVSQNTSGSIQKLESRLTATESVLDRMAPLPDRVEGLTKSVTVLNERQEATSKTIGELSRSTEAIASMQTQLTKVAESAAENRNAIGALKENVGTLSRNVNTVISLGKSVEDLGTRVKNLENRRIP